MMPPYSWSVPGRKPGTSTKVDERDVEGVARPHEAGGLLRGVDVEGAGQHLGLVADDADRVPVDAGEAGHDVAGPVGEDLEEVAVVDDLGDDLLHVVGLVGAVGDQVDERRGRSARRSSSGAKYGGSSRLFDGRNDRR